MGVRIPMRFEIVRKGQMARMYQTEVIHLYEDRWNDWFRYVTMYQLTYTDSKGQQFDLGNAKFGQFDIIL